MCFHRVTWHINIQHLKLPFIVTDIVKSPCISSLKEVTGILVLQGHRAQNRCETISGGHPSRMATRNCLMWKITIAYNDFFLLNLFQFKQIYWSTYASPRVLPDHTEGRLACCLTCPFKMVIMTTVSPGSVVTWYLLESASFFLIKSISSAPPLP